MKHRTWIMVLLLLAVACISFPQLDVRSLWFDEIFTYYFTGTGNYWNTNNVSTSPCADMPFISFGPVAMLCMIGKSFSWPPAYYILYSLWNTVTQGNLFMGRLLSSFLGLVALCVIYKLGKLMLSPRAGLIVAILLGGSTFVLYYYRELRAYTMYLLLTIVVLYFYWKILQTINWRRRSLQWGLMLSLCLALYTHYVAICLFVALTLYHVLVARPQLLVREANLQRWWSITRQFINATILFAFWGAFLLKTVTDGSRRDVSFVRLFREMSYGFTNNLWWLIIPILLLSLCFWRFPVIRFLWVLIASILGFAAITDALIKFLFHPRFMIVLLPLILLLLAYVADRFADRYPWLVWSLIGLWLGTGMVYTSNDAFMNRIELHVPKPLNTAMQTIINTAQHCIASDALLAASFTNKSIADEFTHAYTLDYYLLSTHIHSTVISYMVDSTEQFTEEIKDRATVWAYTLPEYAPIGKYLQLDERLRRSGYTVCGLSIQRSDLVGTIYSRDAAACPTLLSCASTIQ